MVLAGRERKEKKEPYLLCVAGSAKEKRKRRKRRKRRKVRELTLEKIKGVWQQDKKTINK
jgi:hypothetical protein